ncbi:MAG TPA: ribokinase [Roseiflexaceae bacterium]
MALQSETSMIGRTPAIVVIGSLNMDLVTRTARQPQRGETLIGESFALFVGGKGLNQAIAAARQGAAVRMVGRLGQDDFGRRLRQTLHTEGIDAWYITEDGASSTGIATIVVDAEGDNSIIVVPGANGRVGPEDVERAADAIAGADTLILQLEVPLDAVQRAAEIAHAAGVRVLLNPAPARSLPDELLRLVDVLTPNETETQILTGLSIADDEAAGRAAGALLARGVGATVLTLGSRGALLAEAEQRIRVPGYPVRPIDTTAAGDAFCGALAVQLARGYPLDAAIRYANAAGALATTVMGAEPAMPKQAAVEQFIADIG